jgi:hypothetical protein
VNFEPFCGNTKPVESRESRVESRESRVDPPTRCAAPAGHGSSG